ncbi:MAG: CopG family transcriptional regulator [Thermodesulfobacterium geofontis]|uniref:CopG family transcriptional regulator n=1 Tax=Thermodesulfobacterium geofontis TaxID=1295609 RepID=A0A2N7Q7Z0_9BACT|nr:MAG: CopG family transcriptional regulator [Thermodesulfobacterium geofontis]PMP94313.1 MAG: CopG family transcriptional regulator [Thermodesulfobacterium geofontis]
MNKKDKIRDSIQKIGIVAIVVSNRSKNASLVNRILSEHSEIILGRLGLPRKEEDIGVITLIVEGDTDSIGSMTGKLGNIKGVSVKSLLIPIKKE